MIRLILMAALLFVSGAAMAQKVVVGAGDAAIIDNRRLPAGATTAKKARVTDATTSTNGTNDLSNLASAESNKTVSVYFEVMKTDHSTADWLGAITGCASYDSGDGKQDWRLPTQRELMLIWTLQATLIKKVSGFIEFGTSGNNWYRSATGASYPSWAWYVFFQPQTPGPNQTQIQTGLTYDNEAKGHYSGVRCIRDLTPPAN